MVKVAVRSVDDSIYIFGRDITMADLNCSLADPVLLDWKVLRFCLYLTWKHCGLWLA